MAAPEALPDQVIVERTQRKIEMLPPEAPYRLYLQRVFDGLSQAGELTNNRCTIISNTAIDSVNAVITSGNTDHYNHNSLPDWADRFQGTYQVPERFKAPKVQHKVSNGIL